jgi:peptidoglycan/LPS O-acetylase OafA/YrhL
MTVALLPALAGLAGDRIAAHAPLDIFQPALALPVVRCLAEFTLGLIAYRIAGAPAGRALSGSHWAAPAIVTATLAMLTLADTDVAIVMLFVGCLIALSAEGNLPARWLSAPIALLAGRLSYSIYLTHLLFGGLVSAIHDRVQTFGLAHAHSYGAAAGVLATLVTSLLLYKWIEVPARRALRRAFDGARDTNAEAGATPSRVRVHD